MFRVFAALLLLAAPLLAADPPPYTPALPTATVTVLTGAVVKDGTIQMTEYKVTPVQKTVTVKVKKGEVFVDETRTVTETVMTPVMVPLQLKGLKATGTDGKAIPADDVEKKLKGGAVVLHTQPLSDDVRKAFKDGTVFLEQAAAVMPAPPAKPEK